eukprot:COSAG03_NODE_6520_length_1047_cov_2.886076_1_plen_97_part_00
MDEPGSWTEPYWFCDQYTNDTVQSPPMQQWKCSLSTSTNPNQRLTDAVYTWPSCGGGCVQNDTCIACFEQCGELAYSRSDTLLCVYPYEHLVRGID